MIFFTGDKPVQALMHNIGNENNLSKLTYQQSSILWSGCIDAPDYLPTGSMKNVDIGGEAWASASSVRR